MTTVATPSQNGTHNRIAETMAKTTDKDGMLLPHYRTFTSVWNLHSRQYHYRFDEAIRQSPQNALAMRRDAFIMALRQERYYPTANTNWHIETDDDKDPIQQALVKQLTAEVRCTPYLSKLFLSLLEAIWYGRYGSQITPRQETVNGLRVWVVGKHKPVNGDKIQFSYDDIPGVMVNSQWTPPPEEMANIIRGERSNVLLLDQGKWRDRFIIHKHELDDADFFEGEMAGAIHGVGLRSRLNWVYWLRDEMLAWCVTFMEKVGLLGLLVFYYEEGNNDSFEKAQQAAQSVSHQNAIVVPIPKGQSKTSAGADLIPASTNGVSTLQEIISGYFERHIERLIVGQSMSSGHDQQNSLGGTGRAEFAADTKYQLLKFDADNLGETLTSDLLGPLMRMNHSALPFKPRFVFDVPDPRSKDKLASAKSFVDMGGTVIEDEVRKLVGFSRPTDDDDVIGGQQMPPGGMPGQGPPGDGPPEPGQDGPPGDRAPNGENGTFGHGDQAQTTIRPTKSPTGAHSRESATRYESGLRAAIADAVADVHPDPSEAQKQSGNYRKGHLSWKGLPLTIETAKGQTRSGKGKDGTAWSIEMKDHYGYIKRTESEADGDHIDVFLSEDHPDSDIVFVVNQVKPSGRFDEHKCILGQVNIDAARECYLRNYSAGWKCGTIVPMTIEQFALWIEDGDTSAPVADHGTLAYDKGDGQWITIGAKDGKGGSPVYIQDGRITKGHPSLTGKKLGDVGKEKSLKSRIVEHVKERGVLDLGELRHAMGHHEYDREKPLSNPVHAAVRELRDAGHLEATDRRFGDPYIKATDKPYKESALSDGPAFTHRQELRQSKEYSRAKRMKQARELGIKPDDVKQTVEQLLKNDHEYIGEHNQMLKDARKALDKFGGAHRIMAAKAKKGGKGQVEDYLKGLDTVARELAGQYPGKFGNNYGWVPGADYDESEDDAGAILLEYLHEGNRQPMTEDEAYSQAIDQIQNYQEENRPKWKGGDDDIVPFAADDQPPVEHVVDTDGTTDTRDLSEWYAKLWNSLEAAGMEVPEEEFESAGEELANGEWIVFWDDARNLWRTRHAAEDEHGTVLYEVLRAPKGGVSIAGKTYRGGQFIPNKDQEHWDAGDKAKFKAAQSASQQRHGETRSRLLGRGKVDHASIQDRLKGHTEAGDAQRFGTYQKQALNALHRHYGDALYHRLDEIADQLEEALKITPDDEEGIRANLRGQLAAVHWMAGEAQSRGVKPAEQPEPALSRESARPAIHPTGDPVADAAQAHAARSERAGLVPLTGSPKQIDWGERSRSNLVRNFDVVTNGLTPEQKDELRSIVKQSPSAAWFIDARGRSGSELLAWAKSGNPLGDNLAPFYNNHPLVKDYPGVVDDLDRGSHALVKANYGDPLNAKLRQIGGKWDSYKGRWKVPVEKEAELRSVLGPAKNKSDSTNPNIETTPAKIETPVAKSETPAAEPEPPPARTNLFGDTLPKEFTSGPPMQQADMFPGTPGLAESGSAWMDAAKDLASERGVKVEGFNVNQQVKVNGQWHDVKRGVDGWTMQPVASEAPPAKSEREQQRDNLMAVLQRNKTTPPKPSTSPPVAMTSHMFAGQPTDDEGIAARVALDRQQYKTLHSIEFHRKRLAEFERNFAGSNRIANSDATMPEFRKNHELRAKLNRALADDLRQRILEATDAKALEPKPEKPLYAGPKDHLSADERREGSHRTPDVPPSMWSSNDELAARKTEATHRDTFNRVAADFLAKHNAGNVTQADRDEIWKASRAVGIKPSELLGKLQSMAPKNDGMKPIGDKSGPHVFHHGSRDGVGELSGQVFASKDPEFAKQWTGNRPGSSVRQFHGHATKQWDYKNPEHVSELMSILRSDQTRQNWPMDVEDQIRHGNWGIIEAFLPQLWERGYDAISIAEHRKDAPLGTPASENVVFKDASQLKPVQT